MGEAVELGILLAPRRLVDFLRLRHVELRVVRLVLAVLVDRRFRLFRLRRLGWLLLALLAHGEREAVGERLDAAWVRDDGLERQRVANLSLLGQRQRQGSRALEQMGRLP